MIMSQSDDYHGGVNQAWSVSASPHINPSNRELIRSHAAMKFAHRGGTLHATCVV